MNYYNDHDEFVCDWLDDLMSRGLIPPGIIDQRSILDVKSEDLEGFTQCHFFAGIGGWPLALQLAGVSPETPLWTGSPPCQPFSSAGLLKGDKDERHLAPHFAELIRAGKPPVVFGEQVASKPVLGPTNFVEPEAGAEPDWAWVDDLFDTLEASDHACTAAVIPAAGVGAPHIRARTFFSAIEPKGFAGWLGNALSAAREWQSAGFLGPKEEICFAGIENGNIPDGLKHASASLPWRQWLHNGGMADGAGSGLAQSWPGHAAQERDGSAGNGADSDADSPLDPWRAADWIQCHDGKWRPVEPGTFPLAGRIPNRVGILKGYGNAIVPQVAAQYVRAFLEACLEHYQFGNLELAA